VHRCCDEAAGPGQPVSTAPAIADELISRQVGLDEAHDAFTGLAAHVGTPGKVLVRLDR
jgi:hypothetical protein